DAGIAADGGKKAGGERRVAALEQLQKDETDRIALRQELIAARAGELRHETFGPQFREVVSRRGQRILFGAAAERLDALGMEFRRREGIAAGNVGEAHERMHQGELARVVKLEPGNALSRRGDRRFGEPAQLTAIDEGLQNVLLDIE